MDDSSVRRTTISIILLGFTIATLLFGCNSHTPKPQDKEGKTPSQQEGSDSLLLTVPGTPITYDSTKRYIYLTFDDGPQNGTMNCYRTVQELGVKASFFMIGVQAYEEKIMQKVDSIRNGYPMFLLCNHTFTHANHSRYPSYYNNTDSALRDIEKNQAALNIPLKIMRMPGHNSWSVGNTVRTPKLPKELCRVADSAGYTVAGWDVEWHFKNYSTPVEGAGEMLAEVQRTEKENALFNRRHIVILAHDRMFEKREYADSLRKFISLLKQDPENVFETIDHYPGIAGQ